FDNLTFRRAQSRRSRQLRGQKFIGKHTNVLRIILKLDHVNVTVSAQHELPLRATPHSPDLLHRQNRQSFPHLRRYSIEFYAIGWQFPAFRHRRSTVPIASCERRTVICRQGAPPVPRVLLPLPSPGRRASPLALPSSHLAAAQNFYI